ncbi:stage II sporulation protein D [Clostridium ganghwense]|uniref:Stage II sporulation protein D n=1 Tax=Clostridium ganghwense TaxID=312089 RepID=A0ABT4CP11_9CLOT|nr:stage II sporulation protein D [Clostridium ganghwense]MCY6369811.1 stage II sporulation protein D [Clostridium ganghwense]
MKKIILGILIFISFTLLLAILIVGIDNKNYIGKKTKQNKQQYLKEKSKNIILEKYSSRDLDIEVYITKNKKIQKMNIEEYVKGVVAGEMPVNFDIEALKAQAIAARTYGLARLEKFGGEKSLNANGADVNDTIEFQVFMSKDDRIKLWPKKYAEQYWKKLSNAIDETKGEVLVYDNRLVMEPYYFSTSGGRTEDAVDVFSKDVPYLKSVESPGEDRAPKYKTQFTYTYNELTSILNKVYPKSKLSAKTLKKQIKILERSRGGSVKKIKIGDTYITGSKFRSILGLTSSNFTIDFSTKNVCVNCNGYGHGVGMSQWGADVMAKEGKDYKEILKHYYQGVDVIKLNIKN